MTEPELLAVERRVGDGVDEVRLSLRIPAELHWFEGHFPGMPLLPGVVQTHWAVMFARQQFTLPPRFLSMSNMKFMRFILPDTRIELQLRFAAARRELSFEYREGAALCGSGRMGFGPERDD